MPDSRIKRVRDEHFKNIETATTYGKIVSVSPGTESIVVDIGSATVQVAHPFVSGSSWIRAIPSVGTGCTLSYNSNKKCYEFVAYAPSKDFTQSQMSLYAERKSLYRSLREGEIEIASSGGVSTFFGSRPVVSGRAGAVSWSYDSDKLESSVTAPTHIMRGHNNKLDRIGNEIRFGAVKRPVSYARDLYALTSPGSMPMLESYVYAYEYLMNIENDNSAPLVDIRLGEVYDNTLTPGTPFALPALSRKNKLPLRARHRYHNTIEPGGLKTPNQSTEIEIDCLGNVDVLLSKLAVLGMTLEVPTGNLKVKTGLATSLTTRLAMSLKSELDKINVEALRGIDLKSSSSITSKSSTSTSLSSGTSLDLKSSTSSSLSSGTSTTVKAGSGLDLSGLTVDVASDTTLNIKGVLINISGKGHVTISGMAGLSIAGAMGVSGKPLPQLPNDIVTGLPLWLDPTLTT